MRAGLVFLVLALGCGTRPLAIVLDASVTPPPDLKLEPGVACGMYHCASDVDQFCDSGDQGITGTCRAHVPPTQKGYGCDGPEDCPTNVCCHTVDGSACSALGFCTLDGMTGDWMCHTDPECGAGFVCCDLGSGSPYRICKHAC